MTDKLSITFASKLIEQFAAWFQKLEKLGEFFPFRDFELVHVLQLMSDIDAFLTDPKLGGLGYPVNDHSPITNHHSP